MKTKSRAQEKKVSMKRLRRHAKLRLERIRNSAMAIGQAWCELEDDMIDTALREFDDAVRRLDSALGDIADYHEEVAP